MKKTYQMAHLDCANCAAKMEHAIAQLASIEKVRVSFLTQRMTVEMAEGSDVEAIMRQAAAICKKIEPDCKIIL